MLAKGKAKKLTIYVSESDKRHGKPVSEWIVEIAHKHGIAGATVTRGVMGYGAGGFDNRPHPDLAPNLPLRIEIVDTPDAIDRILPDVYDVVEDGLVELADTEVVKVKPRHPPVPAAAPHAHLKLQGKAKMMQIHIGADDRWDGEPLADALVKRFHFLDLAGVTVYRGLAGYGASGRVHHRKMWRSADEPITLVIVDTAANLERAMPAIDEMLGGGIVVMSDVDVVFYRETAAPPDQP
jgi:PII-like signaling protein